MTRRMIRPQSDLLAKEPFGACEIALLSRYSAQIAAGGSVGGINAQDRSIEALRIFDRTPALRCQGIFQ